MKDYDVLGIVLLLLISLLIYLELTFILNIRIKIAYAKYKQWNGDDSSDYHQPKYDRGIVFKFSKFIPIHTNHDIYNNSESYTTTNRNNIFVTLFHLKCIINRLRNGSQPKGNDIGVESIGLIWLILGQNVLRE